MRRENLAIRAKQEPLFPMGFTACFFRAAKRIITKKRIAGTILWLCWALLLGLGFSNANRLAATYPTVSLRYDVPLSNTAATTARRFAAEGAVAGNGNAAFWPTFWREQQGVAVAGLHTASARCLWFSGDAALVWPANFVQGASPGPLDDAGCCISDSLAWQLWRNKEVLGYEIVIEGRARVVQGVFREDDLLVLAGVGEAAFAGGWQAAELAGAPDGDVRSAALGFAQRSGLGAPGILVDGPAISSAAKLLSVLPLVAMGIALVIALLRLLAKMFPGKWWILLFGMLLAFALVLPALLELLPPSFIPTRFSDFGFWERLLAGIGEQAKEWLLLNPAYIDLRAKLLLLAQAALFIAQGVIGAIKITARARALAVKKKEG